MAGHGSEIDNYAQHGSASSSPMARDDLAELA
jgi:hypothetical protein